jgi:hypothetical protein
MTVRSIVRTAVAAGLLVSLLPGQAQAIQGGEPDV